MASFTYYLMLCLLGHGIIQRPGLCLSHALGQPRLKAKEALSLSHWSLPESDRCPSDGTLQLGSDMSQRFKSLVEQHALTLLARVGDSSFQAPP
jgi:hypothetical protein